MFKKACPEFYRRVRPVQSGVEEKAAAVLTRGAYSHYVSASGAKRQVCEPEGQAKGRRCLCEPLRQSQRTLLAAFFNIPNEKLVEAVEKAMSQRNSVVLPVNGKVKSMGSSLIDLLVSEGPVWCHPLVAGF